MVLKASQGVRKMANAHFRALGGNHSLLPEHSVITMTTTQSLPSSVAKTIEILIKAILFFFISWKKTSTKCYPEKYDQKQFRNSAIFSLLCTNHMTLSPHPQSLVSVCLNVSEFIGFTHLDLSGYLI